MGRKILLIHWNRPEAKDLASKLRAAGSEVSIESEDGARAYARVKKRPPDVMVIYLTRLPSHGRETADAVRRLRQGRNLPIVFVDGSSEDVKKTQARIARAFFTTSTKLLSLLDSLSPVKDSKRSYFPDERAPRARNRARG